METIKVFLYNGAKMPTKAHKQDAGYDLFAPHTIKVEPNSSAIVDTGVHFLVPDGYVGMIKSKSGLNVMDGILCEGVIDAGYTGGIIVKLYNHSDTTKIFKKGEKITQIVVVPIADAKLKIVDSLDKLGTTERADKGFGSTGR